MTLQELLSRFGRVVALLRHAKYILQPLVDDCGGDRVEAWSRNYSELEKPGRFLLSKEGCEATWAQGALLAASEIDIREIQGSQQGRGTHTALCLAEGIALARGGVWPKFRDLAALNYPLYDYHQCLAALHVHGDAAPAMWMNGKLPGLIRSETPLGLRDRVVGHVAGTLRSMELGLVVMSTHFELATIAANEFTHREHLGGYSESRFPRYNSGTIVVLEDEFNLKGFPFNEKWEILEP